MSPDTWMPLFVGRYLHDTAQLNPAQHGAYLLLLMHYWLHGPLEDDDEVLAAIVRVDCRTWRKLLAPRVRRFFQPRDGQLFQKRMEIERARAADISSKRRPAAIASHNRPPNGGGGNGANAPSFADANAEANGAANAQANAQANAVSKRANALVHSTLLPRKNLNSLEEEGCRERERAREDRPEPSIDSQPLVSAMVRGFKNNYPPRAPRLTAAQQIEAVAPVAAPRPKTAHLTREQINAALRKIA